jgi:hypothetical protein
VPPAKFIPEKDDIFFASKIEIEGDDATHYWDGGEANQINAAVVRLLASFLERGRFN